MRTLFTGLIPPSPTQIETAKKMAADERVVKLLIDKKITTLVEAVALCLAMKEKNNVEYVVMYSKDHGCFKVFTAKESDDKSLIKFST